MSASVHRRRAEEMLAQAARAQTDDLRALYLQLAREWKEMADQAEGRRNAGHLDGSVSAARA